MFKHENGSWKLVIPFHQLVTGLFSYVLSFSWNLFHKFISNYTNFGKSHDDNMKFEAKNYHDGYTKCNL